MEQVTIKPEVTIQQLQKKIIGTIESPGDEVLWLNAVPTAQQQLMDILSQQAVIRARETTSPADAETRFRGTARAVRIGFEFGWFGKSVEDCLDDLKEAAKFWGKDDIGLERKKDVLVGMQIGADARGNSDLSEQVKGKIQSLEVPLS